MKNFKKILATIIAVLTVIPSLSGMVVFAETDTTPKIVVGDVIASPGKTVDVTISLANNPGIASMILTIGYNKEYLMLQGVADSGLIPGAMHDKDITKSPYILSWNNGTLEEDITSDGVTATLSFMVAENTPIGQELPISVSYDYDMEEIMNVEMEVIYFETVNGSITVKENNVPVTGVTVSPAEITMKDTETVILNALLSPETATDKTVTWTMDKFGFVTLGETGFNEATGQPYVEVIGIKGDATVTITASANGFTSSCIVTVVCGHNTLTHCQAVAAECENPGRSEYWYCGKCGDCFSDAEAKTEISREDTVIPAIGHKMGEWVVTKQPTTSADGTAERVCMNGCGLKETKSVARIEIPVSDESNSGSKDVLVNVIEGDKATGEEAHVSINQEDLDKKLEELGASSDSTGNDTASGVITIDVAAVADAVESIDAINQVTIPKTSVEHVADAANNTENNTTSLEVKLTSGSVQFDAAALKKISESTTATEITDVKMVVNTVEAESEDTAEKAVEIAAKLEMNEKETEELTKVAETVSSQEGEILSAVEIAVVPVVNNEAKKENEIHNLGGKVTVTINADLDGLDIFGVTIHHISPNGETEEITAKDFKYDSKNKTITFTVEGFSAFVLTYVKPESYILGDVNGDGVVNTSDARYILRYVVKYVDAGINVGYGDVNNDKVVNTSDARYVLRYVVKYDDHLGIGNRVTPAN